MLKARIKESMYKFSQKAIHLLISEAFFGEKSMFGEHIVVLNLRGSQKRACSREEFCSVCLLSGTDIG
jgi:hypothetical protein